jgi:hypothetical protein
MPRYVVEREFPNGFPLNSARARGAACQRIIATNDTLGVTWLHSYVSEDGRRSYCLYEAPSPEAVRRAANHSHWPVEAITKVTVLDPYFYRGRAEQPRARTKERSRR